MPVEGQWERRNRPLRTLTRRERRAFATLAVVVALGGVAVLVWALTKGGDPAPRAGCISVYTGSAVGAVRLHGCGAQAKRLCAGEGAPQGRPGPALAAACRHAGIR